MRAIGFESRRRLLTLLVVIFILVAVAAALKVLSFVLRYLESPKQDLLQHLLEQTGPLCSSSSLSEMLMGGLKRLFNGLNVYYLPYDWQSPFSPHKPFDPQEHIL